MKNKLPRIIRSIVALIASFFCSSMLNSFIFFFSTFFLSIRLLWLSLKTRSLLLSIWIRNIVEFTNATIFHVFFMTKTVFFLCFIFFSHAGKPMPVIHWYRDSIPIHSETYETNDGKSVKSDITLGPLGRQDLNTRLTCKAINHPRASPLETTVQIDMNCK